MSEQCEMNISATALLDAKDPRRVASRRGRPQMRGAKTAAQPVVNAICFFAKRRAGAGGGRPSGGSEGNARTTGAGSPTPAPDRSEASPNGVLLLL